MNTYRRLTRCVGGAALALVVAACSNGASGGSGTQVQLTGAGSSFVYPFFSKALFAYNKMHSNISVNYQSIGSGGGIQQFSQKSIDFGASDVPMDAKELARAGGDVIQIPVALGGESIVYNLPGLAKPVRVSRKLLADLFLGNVTKWNDPKVAALNSGASLPNVPVVVVHRAEGSGTTYIFTDFLSAISPQWRQHVGRAKSVSWPAPSSVGGKGNEGVAGQVRNTPGAIGYVELAYAIANKMQSAVVQNKSGAYLADTAATVKAASATKPGITPANFSIVDEPGANSYPIAGYTWAMVYRAPADKARGRIVRDVLTWIVGNDAQAMAGSLDYVPLPGNVQSSARKALAGMRV